MVPVQITPEDFDYHDWDNILQERVVTDVV